jgi:hypothetical protein
MFLPEQKLMSSEGKVLKQFQRVAGQLINRQYDRLLYSKMFRLSLDRHQSVIVEQA